MGWIEPSLGGGGCRTDIAEVVLIQVVYPGGIPTRYIGPFILGTIASPAGQYDPGMTMPAVKEDIERALVGIKAEDPDFQYEIKMPPRPSTRSTPRLWSLLTCPRQVHPGDGVASLSHRNRSGAGWGGHGLTGVIQRRRHLPLVGRRPMLNGKTTP